MVLLMAIRDGVVATGKFSQSNLNIPNSINIFYCVALDRNLQMLLSSLLQNTTYNEAIYSAWGTHGPSRTAMPSISRLQKMVEAAWTRGFDVQGSEQLGCKLHNTRKWIGATEV